MKKIFFSVLISIFLISNVKAVDNYYINSKGVKISYDFLSKVSDYKDKELFDLMSQQEYDFYVDLYSSNYNVENSYEVTRNLIKNDEILDSEKFIMNEDEYNNYISTQVEPMTICNKEDACWETSSKRITLTTNNSTACSAAVDVKWLTVPTVRSYDVIALMWLESATKNYTMATQFYKDSSGKTQSINYDTDSGTNTKQFSNGVGTSMNLANGGTDYYLSIAANLNCNTGMTFKGSYQHAKSTVSLANSKSYTLSTSGLGGVIKFTNSTIANKYDGMQGVSYYAAKI